MFLLLLPRLCPQLLDSQIYWKIVSLPPLLCPLPLLFMPMGHLSSHPSLSVGFCRALCLLHTLFLSDLESAVSSVTIHRWLTSELTFPAYIAIVHSIRHRSALTSLLAVPQALQAKHTWDLLSFLGLLSRNKATICQAAQRRKQDHLCYLLLRHQYSLSLHVPRTSS